MRVQGVYDIDCVTWSPDGKLLQLNYACEAVTQGSLCLAVRSKTHAVLCAIKSYPNELATHLQKTFKIDNHIAVGISGLTADARVICKYMRRECRTHRNTFATSIAPKRLVEKIASKAQKKTYTYGGRPFGVGMLVIYNDQNGPHVMETNPRGEYLEYNAYSIGDSAQSARTYFENNLAKFGGSSVEDLIMHGLKALESSNTNEVEMIPRNFEVCYVGPEGFTNVKGDALQAYLEKVENFDPAAQMEAEN